MIGNFAGELPDESSLDEESVVAEVFRTVQARVKEDNWNMFIRSKFLKQDAESIAKEFGLKRATVHQNVYRITKMLKAECNQVLWADSSSSESNEQAQS